MKIFDIENDHEVGYIQLQDFETFRYYNGPIPDTLYGISLDGDKSNFIKLDRPAEIQFLKDAYWIINIDELNLREEDIIKKGNLIADKMNEIANEHNLEADENRKRKLFNRHKLLNHQMYGYKDLVSIKRGQLILPIPNINSKNEILYEDIGYEVYSSFNPYIVIIKRKDNNPFNTIPFDVVNQTIEILKSKSKFVTEYKYSTTLSPDKKSVVITILFDKSIDVQTKKIVRQPVQNFEIADEQSYQPNGIIQMVQYMFKKH